MSILDALAGAAGGIGNAVTPALQSNLQDEQKQVLQNQMIDAQTARDNRVQEFTVANQQAGFSHEETMQTKLFGNQAALQQAGFAHDTTLMNANHAYSTEQNALNRDMTREQITSNEKIAAGNNATAITAAKIGGVVQQDVNTGAMFLVGKDGTSTAITNPSTGQPLMGMKNLTAAQGAYAGVLKDRIEKLDAAKYAPINIGNETVQNQIEAAQATLTKQLLDTMTLGAGNIGGKPLGGAAATPGPADIAKLQATPSAAALFDQQFGAGSAAKILGSSGATSAVDPQLGMLNTQIPQ
jgi:hypothetical protein